MKEKLALIGALILIIGTCFTVYFYAEGRYALAQEMKKVEQRLDYKILTDQLRAVQERIWQLEDRSNIKKGKMTEATSDVTIKEELRKLYEEKRTLEEKLRIIQKK